jgi:hypothetical protein
MTADGPVEIRIWYLLNAGVGSYHTALLAKFQFAVHKNYKLFHSLYYDIRLHRLKKKP